MMKKGGHKAGKGTYWNMANGSRIDLAGEGVLPGGSETRYIKAPVIVMLAAAPVLGLVFAIFLPFIGIAMAATLAVRKVGAGLKEAAAASTSFAWRPIEAYLTGRKNRKAARRENTKKKKS